VKAFCAFLVLISLFACTVSYVKESDLTVCEIHQVQMTLQKVRISYGLPTREFVQARTLFPHAAISEGGCVKKPLKRYARMLVCQECERLYQEWIQRRKK
jgi:hypothetical protein